MTPPSDDWLLFDVQPSWCLDTNVVVSFLREDDSEPYSRQVMPEQWRAFEMDIASGLIVSPPQVREELERWQGDIRDLRPWLVKHRGMFRELDDDALQWVKTIVNAYPVYGKNLNMLGDLCVIALAASKGLTVITNEKSAGVVNPRRPKIPDVCASFQLRSATVMGFLRRRGGPT